MDPSSHSPQPPPSPVPSPDAAAAIPPSPTATATRTAGGGGGATSWLTLATSASGVSTPALLLAISCATTLLLLASILTILVLLSRLRRSEKTIASLHLQLSSLATAAVSLSEASAVASTQHQHQLDLERPKYFYDTLGRGSWRCSMVLDTAADDTLVGHSHPPHPHPPHPALIDNQCPSCLDARMSLQRRPPTMVSFRPLGRHSVASSSPPSLCTTSVFTHGGSPRQPAVVGAADWSMLPPTPTTRTHPLWPPLAVVDTPEHNLHDPTPLDTQPSPDALAAAPYNPHSPSNHRHTRSNPPPPLTQHPPILVSTSLAPPSTQPLAPATTPAHAHALSATTDTHAHAPPASLLDRHPSVHSDTHAPSFWFQLPPADSATDLPPPPADAASLSATLHLGSTYPYVVAYDDGGGGGGEGVAGRGVDLADITAGRGGLRPGTAESSAGACERDAFLDVGDGQVVGVESSAGGSDVVVLGGAAAAGAG